MQIANMKVVIEHTTDTENLKREVPLAIMMILPYS